MKIRIPVKYSEIGSLIDKSIKSPLHLRNILYVQDHTLLYLGAAGATISVISFFFYFFKATSLPSTLSLYRINNTNGATCILIRVDALLSVSYRDKLGDDKELGQCCV